METTPAKPLTTGIFRNQATDPNLTRTQALRRAMLELIDSGTLKSQASSLEIVSYDHPIFFAPFTLTGDGG